MLIKNLLNDLLWAADIHYILLMCTLGKMLLRIPLSINELHSLVHIWIHFALGLLRCFSSIEKSCRCDWQFAGIKTIVRGCSPVSINGGFKTCCRSTKCSKEHWYSRGTSFKDRKSTRLNSSHVA